MKMPLLPLDQASRSMTFLLESESAMYAEEITQLL